MKKPKSEASPRQDSGCQNYGEEDDDDDDDGHHNSQKSKKSVY